ncbi:hypothetical protein SAMN05192566_0873 [Methylophilus rhizosphaerae]|uniref:DUF4139 domain-containing protein n=1 Tax=Methylophilus rhizosphaerae TaxID=492660 RepID=A0A1G9AZN1_9PROT|nr:DUF4139 domain-containing protein [Methylophilus rhizosphaerae]SDK32035.1 hypothetical protein SAMN05192566_0873 [Methylophilus rhizosphaerae]
MRLSTLLFFTLGSVSLAQAESAITSPQSDQTGVAVTIYNQDLALVKDSRKLKLGNGLSALSFRDVSAQIKPETALLRSLLPNSSLQVLEQNFDFDLLSPQTLLEKFVGQQVSVIKTNPSTGAETEETATVLSAQNGVVLKLGNRIETGIPGRIAYPNVPGQLRDRPTLTTQVQYKGAEQADVELSYLTGGLNWKADYVAELSGKEDSIDLSGWVTLNNTSGTSYPNAKVQLVAGDVNRVREAIRPKTMMMRSEAMVADAPMPTEQGLLEYHLYTLPRATTIADNQTKQVALLSAQHIPARKELVLTGSDYYYQGQYRDAEKKQKVQVFVEFENKENSKLGIPLPKGTMRVYKKDNDGTAQFVGEDQIDHTAKNDTVRLKLGNAFDVTADRVQTDFKNLTKEKQNALYESAYAITLHNAKKEAVSVTVKEPINGDWKILNASHPHEKTSAHQATWKINIPAESDVTLKYRVQVKY